MSSDTEHKKYPEYKTFDQVRMEKEILAYWNEKKIFEESMNIRKDSSTFTFYEGPPSANGTPGIHHVMSRTVKDIFCRFHTLQGSLVKRKGGWDTHGLPVELQVEKKLGISRDDIGKKISIGEYNETCRKTVMLYKKEWDDLTERMGFWLDLKDPYITYTKEYIETLWWIIKRLYDNNLLYKGYTIQPYSPSDGTGLSSHELNQPGCFKNVKDTSIVAQFQIKQDSRSQFLFDDTTPFSHNYLLAWTTTPWTLPSNTALAVGKKIQYVQVHTYNPYTHKPIRVVLAKNTLNVYFSKKQSERLLSDYKPGDKIIPYQVIQEFTGDQLVGISYDPVMPYIPPLYDADKAFVVLAADFVSTDEGTGIVHSSPTFGSDDFTLSKKHGIPPITLIDDDGQEVPVVDRKGKFVSSIGSHLLEKIKKYRIKTHKTYTPDDFYVKNYTQEDESNPNYKNTDVIISIILKEENKAFKVEKYEHSYPHSWRTDLPILYYPLHAWFIRTTAVKEKMLKSNSEINWKPKSTGTGRFGNWIENMVDWNLSRSRYWGTPLPIWRSKEDDEEICIGSLDQLQEEIDKAVASGKMKKRIHVKEDNFDLHRPYIDEIILVSSTGKPMYRELDLIDVWFDSGAMPYAQWHYPFENKEEFQKTFPADFIAEGVDQTRGWFFTLHAIAVMLDECDESIQKINKENTQPGVAFKNVISNGLVLDQDGNKMSKRRGNIVDPFKAINQYGADVVRWYLIENSPPWENLKYNEKGIVDINRSFFSTLFHTYSFFSLYANIDGYTRRNKKEIIPFKDLSLLDRWILSEQQIMISHTRELFEEYNPTKAARYIMFFVDKLSNWYVRLNRKRFWQTTQRGVLSKDKQAAYDTLYEALVVTAQMMSPIAPFFAEWLYQNLTSNVDKTVSDKYLGNLLCKGSVHHTDWVADYPDRRDAHLAADMIFVRSVCSLAHSIRKRHRIKVRTPLQTIMISAPTDAQRDRMKRIEDIIKNEVNVKNIEYVKDDSEMVVRQAKPNYSELGKKYRDRTQEIASIINSFSEEEIRHLTKNNHIRKDHVDITLDDVKISVEDIPGWAVATTEGETVALNITVTEELKHEGLARDFVNRIQNLRKGSKLNVLDKIHIQIEKNGNLLENALQQHQDYIKTETQALSISFEDSISQSTEVDFEEFVARIKIHQAT